MFGVVTTHHVIRSQERPTRSNGSLPALTSSLALRHSLGPLSDSDIVGDFASNTSTQVPKVTDILNRRAGSRGLTCRSVNADLSVSTKSLGIHLA